MTMSNLIEALGIFKKYKDEACPTHCEHDIMYIMGIAKDVMTEEDIKRLEELGFNYDDTEEGWYSFRYGSA